MDTIAASSEACPELVLKLKRLMATLFGARNKAMALSHGFAGAS
jgi:hypothetical protein